MKSFLPDKLYEFLKWLCIVCIPALVIFIKTVFPVWNIAYADQIATTLTAVGLLIGALIGVSTVQYNRSVNADIKQIQTDLLDDGILEGDDDEDDDLEEVD